MVVEPRSHIPLRCVVVHSGDGDGETDTKVSVQNAIEGEDDTAHDDDDEKDRIDSDDASDKKDANAQRQMHLAAREKRTENLIEKSERPGKPGRSTFVMLSETAAYKAGPNWGQVSDILRTTHPVALGSETYKFSVLPSNARYALAICDNLCYNTARGSPPSTVEFLSFCRRCAVQKTVACHPARAEWGRVYSSRRKSIPKGGDTYLSACFVDPWSHRLHRQHCLTHLLCVR